MFLLAVIVVTCFLFSLQYRLWFITATLCWTTYRHLSAKQAALIFSNCSMQTNQIHNVVTFLVKKKNLKMETRLVFETNKDHVINIKWEVEICTQQCDELVVAWGRGCECGLWCCVWLPLYFFIFVTFGCTVDVGHLRARNPRSDRLASIWIIQVDFTVSRLLSTFILLNP